MMKTQTRLTKREQQNLANWMGQLAWALSKAIAEQDWNAVDHIRQSLNNQATELTHKTMGL
jgi:cysteinyl-tRNA synthetase